MPNGRQAEPGQMAAAQGEQKSVDRRGKIGHDRRIQAMYIPTQEERYSKVARITLLLCVVAPSGVVAWLAQLGEAYTWPLAFLYPIAVPLNYYDTPPVVSMAVSALLQACMFFFVVRSHRLTPKGKATLCITWGMLFALIVRVMIAYDLWTRVQG